MTCIVLLAYSVTTQFAFLVAHLDLCRMFENLDLYNYNFCAFHTFCKHFSSLSVNREKSRDLQRGQTDSGQLPLMMNLQITVCLFNFICFDFCFFLFVLQIKLNGEEQ